MRNGQTTFEFYGYRVQIEVEPAGRRWGWKYSIDGGAPIAMLSDYSFSEHAAIEEAGMAARDRIRTIRNPLWRSTSSGFARFIAPVCTGSATPALA